MPDTQANEGEQGSYVNPNGEFRRDQRYVTTRITADGRDGYPVEPGRYRLVVSRACPWASRAVIVRRLLGLADALSMAIAGPTHDQRSWTFGCALGRVGGWIPAAGTRCSASSGCRRRTSPGSPATTGGSRCRRSWTPPPVRWSPTTTTR